MMRTGSCHRLSIPCMSPMARNKLVTALPATLSGYLWGTGLCQLPLLPHSCAFVYMCVCVWTQDMYERKRSLKIRSLVTLCVTFCSAQNWVVIRANTSSVLGLGFDEGPPLPLQGRFKGVRIPASAPDLCPLHLLLKSDSPSVPLSQQHKEWIHYVCVPELLFDNSWKACLHLCSSCKVLMHAVIYKHMAKCIFCLSWMHTHARS